MPNRQLQKLLPLLPPENFREPDPRWDPRMGPPEERPRARKKGRWPLNGGVQLPLVEALLRGAVEVAVSRRDSAAEQPLTQPSLSRLGSWRGFLLGCATLVGLV
jgi:hypothetical protein